MSVIYILYLAYKIYSKPPLEEKEESAVGSFREGVLLQIVNVKVIMLSVTAIATYITGYGMWKGLFISLLIPLTCFFTGLVWAAIGEGLKNVYKNHRKAMNTIFSLSLVALALRNVLILIKNF